MNRNPVCVSFSGLLRVSLPLLTLCCCLFSSAPRMTVQFLSRMLVRRSSQLTAHQEHTVLILHWTKHQFLVPDTHLSRETGQRNTGYKNCFFSSLDLQPSQGRARPSLAKTKFGQDQVWPDQVWPDQVWPDQVWPDQVWPRPSLAKTKFGQTKFGRL